MSLKLNDLLKLDELENVKVRFNIPAERIGFNPIESYHESHEAILTANFWNSENFEWFNEGEIVLGFLRLPENPHKWLLFDISKITHSYHRLSVPGLKDIDSNYFYEHEPLTEYEDYFGRLVVGYHKKGAHPTYHAKTVFDDIEVLELLPKKFDNLENFPGYENVNLNWDELNEVLKRKTWITALQNQKGVYLITDTLANKRYVGSAYGKDMLLGRWQAYAAKGYDGTEKADEECGHGGNVCLEALVKEKGLDYVKANFRYSILDIFKASTDNDTIIGRESFWKEVLLTRNPDFGYNKN